MNSNHCNCLTILGCWQRTGSREAPLTTGWITSRRVSGPLALVWMGTIQCERSTFTCLRWCKWKYIPHVYLYREICTYCMHWELYKPGCKWIDVTSLQYLSSSSRFCDASACRSLLSLVMFVSWEFECRSVFVTLSCFSTDAVAETPSGLNTVSMRIRRNGWKHFLTWWKSSNTTVQSLQLLCLFMI